MRSKRNAQMRAGETIWGLGMGSDHLRKNRRITGPRGPLDDLIHDPLTDRMRYCQTCWRAKGGQLMAVKRSWRYKGDAPGSCEQATEAALKVVQYSQIFKA